MSSTLKAAGTAEAGTPKPGLLENAAPSVTGTARTSVDGQPESSAGQAAAPLLTSPASAASGSLRIVHVGLDGTEDAFLAAAAQGFTHALLSPPWFTGESGDAYLTSTFDRLDPHTGDGGLSGLCERAASSGMALLLDVAVDAISARSPLLGQAGTPFAATPREAILDPRRSERADAAAVRLDGEGATLSLAAWWAPRLRAWHEAGVAGFRLIGLDSFPVQSLPMFVTALRREIPGALVLGWTPGLDRGALRSLEGTALDGVFLSVAEWDWQTSSAWDDMATLLRVAPVIGVDGEAPGPNQAGVAPAPRSVSLAALIGQGWMHVGQKAAAAHDSEAYKARASDVAALNAVVGRETALARRVQPSFPLGLGGPVLALLRPDATDHRSASRAVLALINANPARSQAISGAAVLPAAGGMFQPFTDAVGGGEVFGPATALVVPAGGVRIFTAEASRDDAQRSGKSVADASGATRPRATVPHDAARLAAAAPRLAIEQPTPAVDGGAFPVKAVAGELISVEADIVFDGHEKIAAALRWRDPDGAWHEVAMRPLGNDRWQGAFPLSAMGRHAYVVRAWRDRFETFRDELAKKSTAGVKITLELVEGQAMVRKAAERCAGALGGTLFACLAVAENASEGAQVQALLAPELAQAMAEADDRPFCVETAEIPVDAERIEARFASWYEVFPRSMSDDETRHGTFADVEKQLPRIAGMGFDVLYFPPISPIGRTNRKGRNNTLTPTPDDPGSPYAIGSEDGGHDALHPQLGTLADFQHLRVAAQAHGLELAIDFAIQCSPDHPWLKEHPGWFDWRPDGTIRYAENPPKRYEDIVNVDFYGADAVPGLWAALCDVVLFWAGQGVRLFRVDNPHTKPLPFWQWMIGEVRTQYPDAVFLAEAFTRPKVMYRLAKVGFSQSYTYFTWRNSKRELEEYLVELDTEAPRDFFRPHFFVNTPDINPPFLQSSGRPGFLIRAALAATLSGLWGVYNGFELCEAEAVPGKEEYLDSEKYQLRAWDWDRPGNIVAEVSALNRIRRQNPALQTHRGVRFLSARNDAVLYFEKATADRTNVVLVAVSLDPKQAQEADFDLPLWRWGLPDEAGLAAQDLLTGGHFIWSGKTQRLRLTPEQPYAIWRVRPVT